MSQLHHKQKILQIPRILQDFKPTLILRNKRMSSPTFKTFMKLKC